MYSIDTTLTNYFVSVFMKELPSLATPASVISRPDKDEIFFERTLDVSTSLEAALAKMDIPPPTPVSASYSLHRSNDSPDSSPASSTSKLLSSPPHVPSSVPESSPSPLLPQDSPLRKTDVLDERTRNSAFYREAIHLIEEIELRFGLLVVSLMTERETAAKTWTSTSPYSQPIGPSNAIVLKLAELVPKALGESMYNSLGEEPENVEDLLQDACQAWAAFCVQLAMEHLFFGFRLRTKNEIIGILQSLSAEG